MNRCPTTALATLTAAALGALPSAQAADPYAGAKVDGSAGYYALICGTCPIDSGSVYSASVGGPGQAPVAIVQAGGGWALAGRAGFDGNGLPELGGYGFADIVIDASIPKTYFYNTSTFAQATQRFDYLGSAPQDYRIDYTLEGTFTLSDVDPASLMSAYGGLTVYGSDYNPSGENHGTQLGTSFKSARASLAGQQPFSVSGSVGFTLHPGDAIYVWSALSVLANSSHQVIGSTDAMHTLDLHFGAGDPAQLAAALSAVPEPAPAWLLAVGLLALRLRRRR